MDRLKSGKRTRLLDLFYLIILGLNLEKSGGIESGERTGNKSSWSLRVVQKWIRWSPGGHIKETGSDVQGDMSLKEGWILSFCG